MIIYIDDDYKCYVSGADGRRAIETNEFDGKCPEWIESFRYVPAGEGWARGDGEVFTGMVAPWKDLGEAYAAQATYVAAQNRQYESALSEVEAALEVNAK